MNGLAVGSAPVDEQKISAIANPFEHLDDLLKARNNEPKAGNVR
jgi:hypothetical protein